VPVIIVELWEGRSPEQKRELVKAFTKAMVEIAGSKPDHLHVIFHDVPKESWGRNGFLATELEPPGKQ
jgi:4-oxalocrotonate tautomerase